MKVLSQALEVAGDNRTPHEWLKDEEIDDDTFYFFLGILAESSHIERDQEKIAIIAAGFSTGWEAHKIMLATPVETGPAPDLSDSLE